MKIHKDIHKLSLKILHFIKQYKNIYDIHMKTIAIPIQIFENI